MIIMDVQMTTRLMIFIKYNNYLHLKIKISSTKLQMSLFGLLDKDGEKGVSNQIVYY